MTKGWREMLRTLRERGQSEVLGATLLTGIMVILVATAGLFLFADFDEDDEQLLANIEGEVTADEISLAHDGGDTFKSDEVTVLLTGDTERELNLSANFTAAEVGNDQLAPGDVWEYNTSNLILGAGRLVVIHEPTNTVLLDDGYRVRVAPGGIDIRVESFDSNSKQSDEANVYGTGDKSKNNGERWEYDVYVDFDGDGQPVKNPDDINITLDPENPANLAHRPADTELEAFDPDSNPETVTVNASIDGFSQSDEVNVDIYQLANLSITSLTAGSPSDLGVSGFSSLGTHDATIVKGKQLWVQFTVGTDRPGYVPSQTVTLDAGPFGNFSRTAGIEPDDDDDEYDDNMALNNKQSTFSFPLGKAVPANLNGVGTFDISLESDKDKESITVEVLDDINLSVDLDTDNSVLLGDEFDANATIENVGNKSGTAELTVATGFDSKSTNISLNDGESTTENFTFDVDSLFSGNQITVSATTDNGSGDASAVIPVLEPASFDVQLQDDNIFQGSYYVNESNSLKVDVNVTNTGDIPTKQKVEANVPGLGKTNDTNVTLAGGASKIKTLTFSAGSVGNHTVTVSSDNDTSTTDLRVLKDQNTPDIIAGLSDASGAVGDTVQVDFDVASFDFQGGDEVGSWLAAFSFKNTVLNFADLTSQDWQEPDPNSINNTADGIAASSFSSGNTPGDPALTYEFDIVGNGTTVLDFDNNIVIGNNTMFDTGFQPYDVLWVDGTVEGGSGSMTALNNDETIIYEGLETVSGDGGETSSLAPSGVQSLGPSVDLTGDGDNELPYVGSNGNLKTIDDAGNTQTLVSDSSSAAPKHSKTLMTAGQWNGSDTSVLYADQNKNRIYRVDDSGVPTEVAYLDNNGAQAVLGTGDIDGDSTDELLFADGSQQVRYLEPDGTVEKLNGGGAGSNNGLGVGEPPDFDGDGTVRIALVDGSNNVKLVGLAESDKTFSGTNAKKAPLTTADVDADGDEEIVYVGNDNGNLKYVDNPLGSHSIETVTDDNGNNVSGDDELGVVS